MRIRALASPVYIITSGSSPPTLLLIWRCYFLSPPGFLLTSCSIKWQIPHFIYPLLIPKHSCILGGVVSIMSPSPSPNQHPSPSESELVTQPKQENMGSQIVWACEVITYGTAGTGKRHVDHLFSPGPFFVRAQNITMNQIFHLASTLWGVQNTIHFIFVLCWIGMCWGRVVCKEKEVFQDQDGIVENRKYI